MLFPYAHTALAARGVEGMLLKYARLLFFYCCRRLHYDSSRKEVALKMQGFVAIGDVERVI